MGKRTKLPEISDDISTGLSSVCLSLPVTCTEDIIGKAASSLEDEAVSISWIKTQSGWDLQWVFPSPAPVAELAKLLSNHCGDMITASQFSVKDIPDTNWLEQSYRQFPPFEIDEFFIFGSHYDGSTPKDKIPLQIDAATAFGSGEHGTTRGCLEAILYLHQSGFKPRHILDMGAGSGILGIAAFKLWKKPVLAVDIDKEATRVACHHRKINSVPAGKTGMTCATGDGYAAKLVRAQKTGFDFIIANILAIPLVIMAKDLANNLAPNGAAVLSGLLVEQEADVLLAHTKVGLVIEKHITHGEWRTLILRKKSA
jgi:ribosomal protein L11 methyltransferase